MSSSTIPADARWQVIKEAIHLSVHYISLILEGVRHLCNRLGYLRLQTTMISVLSMSILLFLLAMIQVLLYVKVCFSSLIG